MLRAYESLVNYVPLIKRLVEQGDAGSLDALYKNVRSFQLLVDLH